MLNKENKALQNLLSGGVDGLNRTQGLDVA
jgi:hypothetical protein